MKKQSQIANRKSKIIIVGGGPAGSSLAIRLARRNFSVLLIEREKFPREKLCGEFISPECFSHFDDLGVDVSSVGGERIRETRFFEPAGRSVAVPSKWFGRYGAALSLSRAEMDLRLLERAKALGVEVWERSQVVGIIKENPAIRGLHVRKSDGITSEAADLFIDATGRVGILRKFTHQRKETTQPRFVGFKAHLSGAGVEPGRCEIYSFRGGYSGLSNIENGLSNHCMFIRAELAREFSGDANKIVREAIMKNTRARQTLKNARPVEDWHAVSVAHFGIRQPVLAENVFCVGDSAAFIDPFTGSGILMAFESSKILADCITENSSLTGIGEMYRHRYNQNFGKRFIASRLIRRIAFVPAFAKSLIFRLSLSKKLTEKLATSTRQQLDLKEERH